MVGQFESTDATISRVTAIVARSRFIQSTGSRVDHRLCVWIPDKDIG